MTQRANRVSFKYDASFKYLGYFPDLIYYSNVELLHGGSEEDVANFLADRFGDTWTPRSSGSAVGKFILYDPDAGRRRFFIWIREWKGTTENMFCLMHECMHATFAVFRWINLPVVENAEEAYTYFCEGLFRFALDAYNTRSTDGQQQRRKKKGARIIRRQGIRSRRK